MKTVPKLNLNIPDHTILDKIGEGGMSAVYLGRQISLQRKVAIKVLNKLVMDDKTLAERFVDEAKTVASLDHPHIISIYEAKKLPSGLAYFTMPYLTHGDFGEIICTNSDHLIELLCQICEGLSHAHMHGVIHRDLKPENILFDQFGRIKIADFGIAITKNSKRKTKDTQLLGSAHYMSPEQIQSKEIDHHSDIYSLGCIIYEKLTGDHVFQTAGNDFSILMSHINKPSPELPDALAEWQPIIDQCLAKDPADRYDSVEALKDALLAIKYNKTTPTEPEVPAKTATGTKRPYLWMGLASLLIIILAALLVSRQASDDDQESALEVVNSINDEDPDQDNNQAIANDDKPAEPDNSTPLEMTIGVVESTDAENTELVDLTGNLDNETINQMSVEVTLNEAQQLLKRYRLTKPQGANAADKFQSVLLEQPDNKEAKLGLNQVGVYYFRLIENKIEDNEITDALIHVQSLVDYINKYNIDRSLFEKQVSSIMTTTNGLVTQAVAKRRNNTTAEEYLQMASLLMPDYAFVSNLQKTYDNIPKSGDVVADKLSHNFVYFAAETATGLKDFMVAQNEVTVEQFSRFAQQRFTDDKCHHYDKKVFFKKTWQKPPFEQSTNHPVICLTGQQAMAYADWLSSQTGHTYRLPTMQEFQFLNQLLKPQHNCESGNVAGTEVNSEKKATDQTLNCNDGQIFTAKAQSFRPSKNVYDLSGNVSEWVTRCGNAPICAIGTSWRSGQGTAGDVPVTAQAGETHSHIGFRLIRELD
ncbi:MAG: bifunctional serine/threonine-protein kinase/formylglycine-generating enzyme family protein [Marinicella sp.]